MTNNKKELAIAENYLGEVYAKLSVDRSIGTVKIAINDEFFNFIYTLEYDKEVWDEEEGTHVTYDIYFNKSDRNDEEMNRLIIALGACYDEYIINRMIFSALNSAIKSYDVEEKCWKVNKNRESIGKVYIMKNGSYYEGYPIDSLLYIEDEYED